MEDRIRTAIQEALAELGAREASFEVEWPTELAHGDFATNAALATSKRLGKPPREIADALVPRLKEALGDAVERVEAAGPGFVNITLAPATIASIIETAATSDAWGKGSAQEGRRVMVEYSCPNPFKEMHIGHLMSTVIGEAVSRVIENGGAEVIRDSYGGDVGPHVAKALWALRRDGVTDVASATEVDAAYARGARAYEASEEAKAEIDALNQEIYRGEDPALMDLWSTCREVCLEAFRDLYRALGTHFDYYLFESETAPIGMRVVGDGLARGVFTESEGAVIYDGEKKGLHTLVFITSRGTPTYEAKDIGLAFLKEEKVAPDESIIITAAEQVGHFKVFLAALEDIAPLVARKTSHIPHGFMRLTTGKMSSREGNTITAKGLIEEVMERAKEKNDDPLIASAVAIAAVKYMVLRQASGGDIVFDPEQSLSLDGDSGPYLQYAYVRAKKLLAYDAESAGGKEPLAPYAVERLIIRFPGVAARAERERAPHHIAQYLTRLAGEWNSFYANEQVLGSDEEAYKQRVARAFARTMEKGLALLGIPVPERM
ncbi:MAG TPA: arginine--tRNA ligase [Candidatus Paceibacterota bacterium]|nr:arginine--tRNA ligase [Candidatus Paceibacterota bacterium]